MTTETPATFSPTVNIDRSPWTDRDDCKPEGVNYGDVWFVEILGVPLYATYFQVIDTFKSASWLPADVRSFLANDSHHEKREVAGETATWKFWHNMA